MIDFLFYAFNSEKRMAQNICKYLKYVKIIGKFNEVNKNENEQRYCTMLRKHCAEIEESKTQTRRMTKQELAWWLREKPTRECSKSKDYVYFEYPYQDSEKSTFVDSDILIRENGGEWKEPIISVN